MNFVFTCLQQKWRTHLSLLDDVRLRLGRRGHGGDRDGDCVRMGHVRRHQLDALTTVADVHVSPLNPLSLILPLLDYLCKRFILKT